MVINLATTIALSCPTCGCLEKEKINIFELPTDKLVELKCSCGAKKASIIRKKSSQLEIKYFCLHCNKAHKMKISHQEFWYSKNLNLLSCEETGLKPGFFGPPTLINKELQKQQQDLDLLAEELGFDDFKNPDIMLQALDIIHDNAADEALICECGNYDLRIELFSDKIQLNCSRCGAYLNISAVDKDDLIYLRKLNILKLHSFQGKPNNF